MKTGFFKFKFANAFLQSLLVLTLALSLSSCANSQIREDVRADVGRVSDTLSSIHDDAKQWLNETFDSDTKDLIDPKAGLSRDDYYDLFYKRKASSKHSEGRKLNLPDISQLMIEPDRPLIADDKLVTISVTEDVGIKEVLIELSRRADIDMEIDTQISGGVIFSAKEKPFSEVIERLANLAGLRYSVKNGVLKVERDLPYIVNYKLNILNLVRTSEGSVNTATELGGGDGGATSGSSSSLTIIQEDSDVWASIEEGVTNIITQFGAEEEGAASSILSLNRQSGIVTVLATSLQHTEVKGYLDYVHLSQTSQVLIEAKIVEVSLKDEFRSGIDWSFLNSNVTGLTARSNFFDAGVPSADANEVFTLGLLPTELFGLGKTSLEASIQFVEQFGTTRTLSSPRINAMNNQYAVLTFAENRVFFELTIEEEENEGVETLSIDSNINTVPIGVLLTLIPSIDLQRGEVTLSIRPTLSRVVSEVSDPAVAILAAQSGLDNIEANVPVVDVREMDSILNIKSGHVMVIGGLMKEEVTNTDRGVPGLSSIPYIGNAFKSVSKTTVTVETVIFIKATIVPGTGVSVADAEFYRKFTDRHSFGL